MSDDLEPLDAELEKIIEIGTRVLEHQAYSTRKMEELAEAGTFTAPCHEGCEGWIRYEHDGETLHGPCPLKNQVPPCLIPGMVKRALSGDLGGLGWPSRYLEESEWASCPVADEVRSIPSQAGILLVGPVGTGKTSTAALVAMQRWPRQRMRYVYWGELIELLGKRLPEVATAQSLCIDDYGIGTIPEWKYGAVDYLFEYRNSRRLPTIITSNMTVEQLTADEVSQRWVDRWRQLLPFVITIGGDSRRK